MTEVAERRPSLVDIAAFVESFIEAADPGDVSVNTIHRKLEAELGVSRTQDYNKAWLRTFVGDVLEKTLDKNNAGVGQAPTGALRAHCDGPRSAADVLRASFHIVPLVRRRDLL